MVGQCHKSIQYITLNGLKTLFTKNYNEEYDEVYFLEVDVQYPEKLHERHNDLTFLPEKNENQESWKARY